MGPRPVSSPTWRHGGGCLDQVFLKDRANRGTSPITPFGKEDRGHSDDEAASCVEGPVQTGHGGTTVGGSAKLCCSFADGHSISDGRYRVRLNDEWIMFLHRRW
jgi:hypothetical protein